MEPWPLAIGTEFSPSAAQGAAERLRDLWQRADFPLARVRWDAIPAASNDGLEVVFVSEPGPRGRLKELRFSGNRAIGAEALRAPLRVRPARHLWDRLSGRDQLRLDVLAQDRQALRLVYEEAGYLEVDIGAPQLEFVEAIRGFRLTWPIRSEGPRYHIRQVYWRGDPVPPSARRAMERQLTAGSAATPSRVKAAGDRLRELLAEEGYGFAEVEVTPSFDPSAASVDLEFHVRTGVISRLREIRLLGLRRTRDRVLRREIPLRPGEPYHAEAIRAAHRNLIHTGLFSAVDIRAIGHPAAPEFDLEVEVTERQTGRVEAGLTYGTVEGAAFLLRIIEENLALRPPWRGDAIQGRASALVGTKIRRWDLNLKTPRIRDSLWGIEWQLFDEDNRYISDLYDQKSRGTALTLIRPLGGYHALSFGYGWTLFEVYDFDARLAPPPREETDVNLTALVLGWRYDRLNDAVRPTRGVLLQQHLNFGLAALGGDTEVVQYRGRAVVFLPTWPGQCVLLRAGAESVSAYGGTRTVPLPLRIWLGGPETLRGFAYRSISPFNETGVPTGGHSSWWSGVEYVVPLFRRLDVSVYYETGEAASASWPLGGEIQASDAGIGFWIRAQNFPVRFDAAVPTSVPADDRKNRRGDVRYSFSAGYLF